MLVETAYVGALGFDTDTKLDAIHAGRLASAGYHFCVRYLSLGAAQPGDLDAQEVQVIIPSLALMAVQHVREPGWIPNALMGRADGEAAVKNALRAGIPAGVSVYWDLEGCAQVSRPADVVAFADAWYHEVRGAGFLPGVYVGASCILDAHDLYHKLPFSQYWRSFSRVPDVDVRGYSMLQLYDTQTVAGTAIDIDVVQKDYENEMPRWLTSVSRATTLPSPYGSPDDTAPGDV